MIGVIAILITLLLPSLAQARYDAKIVLCKSNMRQMAMGIMQYTDDFRKYYPDAEMGRLHLSTLGQEGTGGAWANGPGDFDLRPALREYFGVSDLNDIMKCPLVSPFWEQNRTYSDIDGYDMEAFNQAKSPYNFYFGKRPIHHSGAYWDHAYPRNEVMRKPAQSWTAANGDKRFNVLISDFAYQNGWGGSYVATTHYGPGSREGGNYANENYGSRYDAGVGGKPSLEANANFGLDDGSVATYRFSFDSIGDSMWGIRRNGTQTYMVPTILQQ